MQDSATRIRIQVLATGGSPVPDARLMLASDEVDLPDIAALSDDEGRVLLGAFKNASYQLSCAAEGFETRYQALTVGDDDEVDVIIMLVR